MIMLLNNEERQGVRHTTAHFGVVPPFEAERNPEDNVLYSQGQADQRLLIPLPHSPPLPQERQTRVGRAQGVHPAPAAFHASMPPSRDSGPLTIQSLPGGGGAEWAWGKQELTPGAASRPSEKSVMGEDRFTNFPPFCEVGWRRGLQPGIQFPPWASLSRSAKQV